MASSTKNSIDIQQLLKNKTLKVKVKTETISQWLFDNLLSIDELLDYAQKANDVDKATCIEAIEYATKKQAHIANEQIFLFATKMLLENAPRVKWESARVIGNIAHLFPEKLNKTISNLLVNANGNATVVRWSAAYALAEIVKLKTKHNKKLIPSIEVLIIKEQDNSIKKKYLEAIKKANK